MEADSLTSSTPLLEGDGSPAVAETPPSPEVLEQDGSDAVATPDEAASLLQQQQTATTDAATSSLRRRRFYRRVASLVLSPVTDEQDSPTSVLVGLLTMIVTGSILGAVLPKNDALPTPWYRTVSSMIGYTFFVMWSISFYPQVLNNWRRGTTRGLSADFCGLNVLGFACYTTYNVAMFYSSTIHKQYRERHGADAEITVQSNDVAFAVHAFLLASITFLQIGYYDGFRSQRPSTKLIEIFIVIILVVALVYPCLVLLGVHGCNWLDYLYILSFCKVAVTLIKYMPQVVLNFCRKSTVGFSIWQILLDFGGGCLSDLQLVLDSADLQDWSGITGNPAKLCLGMVSILFDIIFMTQHYVLYRTTSSSTTVVVTPQSDSSLLLASNNIIVEENDDGAETDVLHRDSDLKRDDDGIPATVPEDTVV